MYTLKPVSARRLRRFAAFALALLLFSGGAPAARAASQSDALGAKVEAFVAEHAATTAGMSVSVFDAEQTICQGSFGCADLENGIAVDNDTVFEWGSATKLLVWVSVMQLWEQGRLSLDADVRDYLPEGFLSNLAYDTPVTMVHLMNHTAGFQEMLFDLFIRDASAILPLGEALTLHKPAQIFEPGTVTAYSNWGTALAGYIVERVSGQDFCGYVHEHIFDVLGMEHSALAPDLSDNAWVRERRAALQCYTADAELIPNCLYCISLYPAGMCTGTAGDFAAFGQALLRDDCPLFAEPATRDALFTPTAYFENTGVPKNCHGLWMVPYGVMTFGHGGNTAGCSSYLLLDPEGGRGMVVMTNQSGEQVYNTELPELIFGKYKPETSRSVPRGVFRSARTVLKGPAKLYSAGYTILTKNDLVRFWTVDETARGPVVHHPYGDLIPVSTPRLALELALLLLWALGALFSALYLLAWPLGALWRRIRHKAPPPADVKRPLRRAAAGEQLLLLMALGGAVAALTNYAPSRLAMFFFALCAALGLVLLVTLFLLLRRTAPAGKRARALGCVMCCSLVAAAANVLYWQLFMFWAG